MGSLIDLSQEIYEGMPVYAGHLETKVWQHHRHEDTAPELRQRLLLPEPRDHGLRPRPDARRRVQPPRPARGRADDRPDGPRHRSGATGRASTSRTSRRASTSTGERLDRALAESAADLLEGDVLLLRTGTAERLGGTQEYTTQYPGLDQSAADWLGDHKVEDLRRRLAEPGQPGGQDLPRAPVLPREPHHALREPREPRGGRRAAVPLLRVPAADPRRPRLAGAGRRDAATTDGRGLSAAPNERREQCQRR